MEIRELLGHPRTDVERYCEQRAQNAYVGNGEALARVLGKYMMYVDTTDTSLAPHLLMNGYWESWITQALLRLKPGTRCVDVGANHGYYTMVLADLCRDEVFAFEPQTKLANIVVRSANVNGFRNKVKVIQAGVGDAPGEAKIVLPEGTDATFKGSAWLEADHNGPNSPFTVPVVTLDEAVPGEVGFIKIDAEGYEPKIWAGMKRHLESRPTILMEFTPVSYDNVEGFLDEIEACYTLREVDTSGSIVAVKRETLLDKNDFSMLWLEAN